jgi:hypothetical protein
MTGPVIVLDVIEPGVEPDYCTHGRTTCIACDEWVWLGHDTLPVVQSGEALPICVRCATRLIPPESEMLRNVRDHRREDGPHD